MLIQGLRGKQTWRCSWLACMCREFCRVLLLYLLLEKSVSLALHEVSFSTPTCPGYRVETFSISYLFLLSLACLPLTDAAFGVFTYLLFHVLLCGSFLPASSWDIPRLPPVATAAALLPLGPNRQPALE